MSPDTMIAVAAPVVLFGVVAFFIKKPVLIRSAIIALSLVIVVREMAVWLFHRGKLAELADKGQLTEEFADGALLISNYCLHTRPIVYLALAFIVLLGVVRTRNKNQ